MYIYIYKYHNIVFGIEQTLLPLLLTLPHCPSPTPKSADLFMIYKNKKSNQQLIPNPCLLVLQNSFNYPLPAHVLPLRQHSHHLYRIPLSMTC